MTPIVRLLSLILIITVLFGIRTVSAQWLADATVDQRPDPTNILLSVQANFPEKPMHATAELSAKNKRGDVLLTRLVEFSLDFSSPTATAVYVISDAFGDELERLVITRPQGEPVTYALTTGAEQQATPLTDPSAPLEGLDFSWADLTLDFLWWPHVTLLGHENKIGRPCYILEVRPDENTTGTYASVRLWVDENTPALLEAQGFDPQTNLVKKLQIESLKKAGALWTIGDVEVHSYPARSKTRLRMRDIQVEN